MILKKAQGRKIAPNSATVLIMKVEKKKDIRNRTTAAAEAHLRLFLELV